MKAPGTKRSRLRERDAAWDSWTLKSPEKKKQALLARSSSASSRTRTKQARAGLREAQRAGSPPMNDTSEVQGQTRGFYIALALL
ncbi:hypothetical protein JMJ77_0015136 [Colletotrichum scovillei]|uniref:Uncharacterized protein n=1 Tax=Colletotrichum scovillei TaxID=1209932 RepID=A0A9P7R2A4_9PEZI|nr:hypothetical protein JMJ77_0015136 [Colletotrichum scovillei]KAG7056757.1 hypothetical protein JMJ78_0000547 [Colletotrichum scovillei]KAG7066684.1 hypothetical protein JMJ76_0000538 [Colletotrichum scovillei]